MRLHGLIGSMLVGGCLGLAANLLRPTSYQASVSIYFPTVNPQLLSKLNEALQASPDSDFDSRAGQMSTSKPSSLAGTILKSQAAAEYALTKAGENTNARRWSDPLGEFESHLTVVESAPDTLTLKLTARTAESARNKQQGLLDYYSQFTKKNPLTRVRQSKELLEERLAKTARQLRTLEEKMSRSSSRELRSLGDSTLKANPKVMTQLWLRRLEEDQQGRDILNKMQKVRGTAGKSARIDEKWLGKWSKDQKAAWRPSPGLSKVTVRRQDLVERAKLERDYYEALLRYRAYLLQHSFLQTWDDLENTDFTVVDPVRVRSYRQSSWIWPLSGALLGLLYALISSLKFSQVKTSSYRPEENTSLPGDK